MRKVHERDCVSLVQVSAENVAIFLVFSHMESKEKKRFCWTLFVISEFACGRFIIFLFSWFE